ncbi:hypothetical protein HMPREF9621_00554 [Cutibacterium modestum HL037PA2]|nr:hypothetical protein HMPREF9621_00554 [Cutibacterium modestum HL037PA2]
MYLWAQRRSDWILANKISDGDKNSRVFAPGTGDGNQAVAVIARKGNQTIRFHTQVDVHRGS